MLKSKTETNERANTKLPKVTIVIAAYNAEKALERCLDALLALDYPDYEIIVVDNNSKDQTSEIVKQYSKKYKVAYLFESKKGWPCARNTGIRYAETDFVANIDADCFATPQWLKNLISGFTLNDIGCVVGKTLVESGQTLAQQYYSTSNPFGIEHHIGVTPYVPWGGGNNIFLQKSFLKAGGYKDDKYTSGADAEFHARMLKETGYRTVFRRDAIIYHTARGKIREFFFVHLKYASDGYSRSRMIPELRPQYHWYIIRKLKAILLHLAGFLFRLFKYMIGKETKLRLVSPLFSIVSYSGAIYGNVKGKIRNKK